MASGGDAAEEVLPKPLQKRQRAIPVSHRDDKLPIPCVSVLFHCLAVGYSVNFLWTLTAAFINSSPTNYSSWNGLFDMLRMFS